MSAFAGIIGFGDPRDWRGDLDRMQRGLPMFDGGRATSWSSDHAALTHRLFAITPEDRFERQPWTGQGGNSRLVFAGRLDHREELGDALGLPDTRLREMADGALALAALERWGPAALERMTGGFALALWDEKERRLLLARDPMGGRPLFYHRGDGFVAFATSFNPLHALQQVPRALDELVVGDVLAHNLSEQTRTLYQGILRVPSGTLALIDADGVRVAHYWTPQRRSLGLKRHEEYVDAAREQLDRAVRPLLRSERPVAVQCSGGLDSPAVAATAARILAPQRLSLYTRVPPPGLAPPDTPWQRHDEGEAVRALAAMYPNIDLHLIDDDGLHPIDLDPAIRFAANALPVFNPLNHGWFSATVDRIRANGHRVSLDGGWGNFALGWGTNTSLHWHLLRGHPWRVWRELRAIQRVTGRPLHKIVQRRLLRRLEPDWFRRARRDRKGLGQGWEYAGFINHEFVDAHQLSRRTAEIGTLRLGRTRRDPFETRCSFLVRGNEFGRDWTGQTPAFLGHEKRDPNADPRLIEFCLNVPEEQYLRDGWSRALARGVLADRAPPEIHANIKFGVQDAEWFHRLDLQRESLRRDVERIAASPFASQAIDLKRMRAALDDWPANAAEAEPRKSELANALTRAAQMGRFICWVEGRNE